MNFYSTTVTMLKASVDVATKQNPKIPGHVWSKAKKGIQEGAETTYRGNDSRKRSALS